MYPDQMLVLLYLKIASSCVEIGIFLVGEKDKLKNIINWDEDSQQVYE